MVIFFLLLYLSAILTNPVRAETKKIALTFDADLTPYMLSELNSGKVKSWYNQEVADLLVKNKVQATFFLTGMWAKQYPQIVQSLSKNSLFEIGNHSYSHPGFHQPCYTLAPIAKNEKKLEIEKTQDILTKLTGSMPKLFRFPGGCADSQDIQLVENEGLKAIGWDVSSTDAFNRNPKKIVQQVLSHLKNRSIVVFHLHGGPNAPATASALKILIPILKQKGYTFSKVSSLLEI